MGVFQAVPRGIREFSAGPLFETSPVVFRSNSVQLALLPMTLLVLHRYAARKPSGKGLLLPLGLAAAGMVCTFAVAHSDKLYWIRHLRGLYPQQDPVRLLHLYGVEWSARTASPFTLTTPRWAQMANRRTLCGPCSSMALWPDYWVGSAPAGFCWGWVMGSCMPKTRPVAFTGRAPAA